MPNKEQKICLKRYKSACIYRFPAFITLLYLYVMQMAIADAPGPPVRAVPTRAPSATPTATPIDLMHYFLPGSALSINDSTQFCSDLCNSDLASIHSQSQLNDAVHAISVKPKHIWAPTHHQRDEAYIGLTSDNFPSVPFSWYDRSPFNYGNDTNKSSPPWKAYHPQGGYTPACVVLEADTSTWRDVQCNYSTTDRFLCNHCNGQINKYALLTHSASGLTFNQSNAACRATYGTSLASIHTDRDHSEILSLLKVNHRSVAWIGLKNTNQTWEDGTPFDYGTDSEVCPHTICETCAVIQDTNNPIWQHKPCTNSYASICNLPSEISFELNTWYTYGNWIYDEINMHLIHPISGDASESLIINKQWFNGDDPLRIELSFTLYDILSLSNTYYYGINFHSDSCKWYFIGLRVVTTTTSSSYVPQLWRGNDTSETKLEKGLKIVDGVENDMFFTMSIQITNGHIFDVWLNNVKHISYIDQMADSTYRPTHGYSGYISIDAEGPMMSRTRSLYISGAPETVAQIPNECGWDIPSQHPTIATKTPTYNPIFIPSSLPTSTPTALPTRYPTALPTKYPTFMHPTANPSQAPIPPPTVGTSTSDGPSVLPTVNPSTTITDTLTSHQPNHPTLIVTMPPFPTISVTQIVTSNTATEEDDGHTADGNPVPWTQIHMAVVGSLLLCCAICYCAYHWYERQKKIVDSHHHMIMMNARKQLPHNAIHNLVEDSAEVQDNDEGEVAHVTGNNMIEEIGGVVIVEDKKRISLIYTNEGKDGRSVDTTEPVDDSPEKDHEAEVSSDNREESSTFSVSHKKECVEVIKENTTDGEAVLKCKLPPQNRTEGCWL
eukprot:507342_1